MITISLHGAAFFAYHGFYPGEQKLGNCFIVDIEVSFMPKGNIDADDFTNTVNYERLYSIANEQMKQTRKLLETVAQSILDDIKANYADLENIQVMIKKMNPLIGHKIDYSAVKVNYNKA